MRITKITIKDFRGFPGEYAFDLNESGNNLLAYGENGTGKSSLYHAIDEFFIASRNQTNIAEHRNIFSDPGEPSVKLQIIGFDVEGTRVSESGSYEWSETTSPYGKSVIEAAAKTRGCLDYRDLLRTHFVHTEKDHVDLFKLLINVLICDNENPITKVPFGQEWQTIRLAGNGRLTAKTKPRLENTINNFNVGLTSVIEGLQYGANKFLSYFDLRIKIRLHLESEVKLDVTLTRTERIKSPRIILDVDYVSTAIPRHHRFLNEGRLSAIALAIYFASLQLNPKSDLRILALDDVLIGIDMSNRLAVLDILMKEFTDWQIMLFTYDKVWFELVRLNTEESKNWSYLNMFCEKDPDKYYDRPIFKWVDEGTTELLKRAKLHLEANDENAAVLYARMAFEWKLKRYCNDHSVHLPYKIDQRHIIAETFWNMVQKHALEYYKSDPTKKTELQTRINSINALRKVVLNPLSHSGANSISRVEIERAIKEVEILFLPKVKKS